MDSTFLGFMAKNIIGFENHPHNDSTTFCTCLMYTYLVKSQLRSLVGFLWVFEKEILIRASCAS